MADILNTDNDSFGAKSDLEDDDDGWVDGVGEGRSDEANLSAYFRMSEGDDEDSQWPSEGLADITHFQNKAIIHGDQNSISLKTSTSSVDEGEPGKVKSLYDVVFEKAWTNSRSFLSLSAARGNSLDVGLMHGPDRQSRQKCSIEFWYWLPDSATLHGSIVLARRTMGSSADDTVTIASDFDPSFVLWELTVNSAGLLEFRSCGGSIVSSTGGGDGSACAAFERWNHVCVVLSSKDLEINECEVSIQMKGEEVASDIVDVTPPGMTGAALSKQSNLDSLLRKSQLVMGVNHGPGLRLTEIRFWACGRKPDDTQALMYEYLNCAESKKKFKVKIKNKKTPGAFALGAPKGGVLGSNKTNVSKTTFSLAPTGKVSLAPKPKPSVPSTSTDNENATAPGKTDENASSFATDFAAFGGDGFGSFAAPPEQDPTETEGAEDSVPATLWDTALPLSEQVRSSAAAALIRGPPATRHFGGNRGGLPDFIGLERFGVGGIAICGSEKTIVWRDNEEPPALTYPIGSSGAVVSDQMDDEGSEFLCCFLAKEKRMVVFELQSRSVVVELQMTTKLNFWRFLPPEADQNSLCFMLVTPVGGFHWLPLEESPRPHQVWKRGPELQGKKIVNYEEGGSNGADDLQIQSRVGLVLASEDNDAVEAWIVPIDGDSVALQVADVMGACLCVPPDTDDGPFLPLLVTVHAIEEGMFVNVLSVTEPQPGSLSLGQVQITQEIDESAFAGVLYDPPALAMGSTPEAICCSLANILVILVRRKGLVVAYEIESSGLSLIASEEVGHYVIDAVMRYSPEVGGAEIVMLLGDNENPKDGRMVSFCFRAAV